MSHKGLKNDSVAQSRPFNLSVCQFWSIFSKGPKRLTFYSWVLWATEMTLPPILCYILLEC